MLRIGNAPAQLAAEGADSGKDPFVGGRNLEDVWCVLEVRASLVG